MKDLSNSEFENSERLAIIQVQDMSQYEKDDPLNIEFDAVIENPLKIPKLEQVKDEPEDSTFTFLSAETSKSPKTQDSTKFQNEESYSNHREDSQDEIGSKVRMLPQNDPLSLAIEATPNIDDVYIEIEQPQEEIEDTPSKSLDTESTRLSGVPSSVDKQAEDITIISQSCALFPKSFAAISDEEAHRMVAKYFASPSKKIKWQTIKKIRLDSSDGSTSNQPKEMNLDFNAPEDDCLYWRRTHQVQKPYNLQVFYWGDYGTYEEFPDSRDSVSSWCNKVIDDLTCGKRAASGMGLDPSSIDISDISPINTKFIVDSNTSQSESLDNNSQINKPAKFINTTGAHPIINMNKKNDSDSVFCSLWGRKKIWILLKPQDEWKLHSILFKMIGRSRTRPWKPGLVLPSHPRELIVKPSQLDSWGIPYEIVVQYPGDILYLGKRIVLYALDAGPNIGASIGIDHEYRDFTPDLVSSAHGGNQTGSPVEVNMTRLIAAIRTKSQFYECERPWCHATFHLERTSREHAAIHRRNEELSCELCDRYFENLSNLKRHMQYVHAPQLNKVFCPKCTKLFHEDHFPVHDLICKGPRVCACGRTDFRSGAGFVSHQRGCYVTKLSKTSEMSTSTDEECFSATSTPTPSKRLKLVPSKASVPAVLPERVSTLMTIAAKHSLSCPSKLASPHVKSLEAPNGIVALSQLRKVNQTGIQPIELIDLVIDDDGR